MEQDVFTQIVIYKTAVLFCIAHPSVISEESSFSGFSIELIFPGNQPFNFNQKVKLGKRNFSGLLLTYSRFRPLLAITLVILYIFSISQNSPQSGQNLFSGSLFKERCSFLH